MTNGAPELDEQAALHALLADLGQCHRQIVDHVDDTIALAEHRVLEAGQLLGAMVREALAQGEETTELLRNDKASGVVAKLETEAAYAEAHVEALDGVLTELSSKSGEAVQSVDQISRTVSGFEEVLMSARMVGISLRVEVAWLRAEDRLGVVAEQLQHLVTEIEALSGDVKRLAGALGAVLPALKTSMTRVRRARNTVRSQVSANVSELQRVAGTLAHASEATGTSGSESAATIRLRCEEALSRLQFFDPMVQELQRLDVLVGELRTAVTPGANVGDIGPLRFGPRLGDGQSTGEATDAPPAGEVMLF